MNPTRFLSATPAAPRAVCVLSSMLLGFALSWTTAKEPPNDLLADYGRASTALTESVEVFASDQVESLDALRRARAAFAPLAAELAPPLRRGLTTTFASAEAAIGNRSETDLRVQAAVLRGGFQRALYKSALEEAGTDLPRAQELLGVIATDLGMTQTTFSGTSQRALQTTFEEQLAALSLTRLGEGDDRESRYEALATVYGQIFLVQDSPRLPEQTQATLLSAIQALVTDEAIAPLLETLRAQLTEFGQAAQASSASEGAATSASTAANPAEADATSATEESVTEDDVTGNATVDPVGETSPGATNGVAENGAEAGPTASTEALAEIDIAPALTPDVEAADIDAAASAATGDSAGEGDGAAGTPATASTPATTPNAASAPLSPNEQLLGDLRNPLLLVAGALALIGFLGLLFSRRSPVPWRDAALALLLLPVISEGIIALAPTVSPYLTPFVKTYLAPPLEPYLTLSSGDLAAYSLFTNPLTQLVWLGLVVVSGLCLLLGLRSPHSEVVMSKTPADTVVVATHATSAAAPTHPGTPPQTSHLSTGSGFNWDEDF